MVKRLRALWDELRFVLTVDVSELTEQPDSQSRWARWRSRRTR